MHASSGRGLYSDDRGCRLHPLLVWGGYLYFLLMAFGFGLELGLGLGWLYINIQYINIFIQ